MMLNLCLLVIKQQQVVKKLWQTFISSFCFLMLAESVESKLDSTNDSDLKCVPVHFYCL